MDISELDHLPPEYKVVIGVIPPNGLSAAAFAEDIEVVISASGRQEYASLVSFEGKLFFCGAWNYNAPFTLTVRQKSRNDRILTQLQQSGNYDTSGGMTWADPFWAHLNGESFELQDFGNWDKYCRIGHQK